MDVVNHQKYLNVYLELVMELLCVKHIKPTLGVWNDFIGSLGGIGTAADSLVSFIGKGINYIAYGIMSTSLKLYIRNFQTSW